MFCKVFQEVLTPPHAPRALQPTSKPDRPHYHYNKLFQGQGLGGLPKKVSILGSLTLMVSVLTIRA